MSAQPDERPFSENQLESPEYRQRLQRKLNCLIAVLEVACAKVRRSLAGPGADVERLTRIQKNLQDTLQVCQRAKRAIERRERLPEELPEALSNAGRTDAADPLRPARVVRPGGMIFEMGDAEEFEKFQGLGPIGDAEVASVDLEELTRLLQGDKPC